MGKYKLSYVESLILEGDKQKQKDAKYNEMLEMLKERFEYLDSLELNINSQEFKEYCKLKQLIKEATQI
jgi:hypothetical protein